MPSVTCHGFILDVSYPPRCSSVVFASSLTAAWGEARLNSPPNSYVTLGKKLAGFSVSEVILWSWHFFVPLHELVQDWQGSHLGGWVGGVEGGQRDRDGGGPGTPFFDLRSLSLPSGHVPCSHWSLSLPRGLDWILTGSHTTSLETVAFICPHIVGKIYIQPPTAWCFWISRAKTTLNWRSVISGHRGSGTFSPFTPFPLFSKHGHPLYVPGRCLKCPRLSGSVKFLLAHSWVETSLFHMQPLWKVTAMLAGLPCFGDPVELYMDSAEPMFLEKWSSLRLRRPRAPDPRPASSLPSLDAPWCLVTD